MKRYVIDYIQICRVGESIHTSKEPEQVHENPKEKQTSISCTTMQEPGVHVYLCHNNVAIKQQEYPLKFEQLDFVTL